MCNERQHASENVKLRHEVARLKESARYHKELHSSYAGLLYEIRKAAGDPEGKLMQDDLICLIKRSTEHFVAIHNRTDWPAWRVAFQNDVQAGKSAFDELEKALIENEQLKSMIDHGIA